MGRTNAVGAGAARTFADFIFVAKNEIGKCSHSACSDGISTSHPGSGWRLTRNHLPLLLGSHHTQFEAMAAHAFELMTRVVGRDTVSEEFCNFLRPFAAWKEPNSEEEEFDGEGRF